MRNLHFKDPLEFESLFKMKTREVTDTIVDSIEEAMTAGKKTAYLFRITFDTYDLGYEITLVQSEWKSALQSCLDFYHENECIDEQISTWKLLELAKVW